MTDLEKLSASIRSGNDISACVTQEVLRSASDGRCNVLQECVTRNNNDALRKLLEAGFNVNAVDKDGRTPLHYAAARTSLKAAEILLTAGADIDATDKHGNTAAWASLLVAGSDDGFQMFQLIVRAGANLEIKNQAGKSVVSMTESMNVAAIRDVVTSIKRS